MKKSVIQRILVLTFVFMLVSPLISAGVGIKWDKESALVPEKTKTCLTYNIYNPWDDDVYAKIAVSEEFDEILTRQESEIELIPAQTSSMEAMPVEFCFKTPNVYERDCWIGNSLICKQDCNEEMKLYAGEVLVTEVSEAEFSGKGTGGSATQMSVSAPLKVRVQCVPHSRNYSLIYATVALIAAILLAINLLKKKKKFSKAKKTKKKK